MKLVISDRKLVIPDPTSLDVISNHHVAQLSDPQYANDLDAMSANFLMSHSTSIA